MWESRLFYLFLKSINFSQIFAKIILWVSRELESWNQTNRTVNNQNCGSFAWQKFLNTACYYAMKQGLEDTSHSEHCHSHPTRSKRTHGYSSTLKTLSGACFSCPIKCFNISYIFIPTTEWNQNHLRWQVWGCLHIHAQWESDSPPLSRGQWIGGAPVSNVPSLSQARLSSIDQWLF